MAEAIKREDASNIANRLNECKNSLQRGNIFSCLIAFKEVLEKMNSTRMLPADEKALQKEINTFQKNLSSSALFKDTYGPVTFRDNDNAPTLALMRQLVEIKEEEIQELMEKQEAPPTLADGSEAGSGTGAQAPGPASRLQEVKILIERGDFATAREILENQEELTLLLVDEFNSAGIEHRRAGRFDEALGEFRKALVIYPQDEGLFYNIARVHIAQKAWKAAAETIQEGLQVNPHFTEGIKLLKYIRETGRIDE
jgi:tetratricopeptide (TPR) repeat protein